MRVRRLPAAVLGGLLSAVLVTTSAFAAPTAGTDLIDAGPTGTQDVLANDSGPGSLTVTGASAPAHGTATCSSLGACLYKADDGYAGTDSFTYTVRDGGGETAAGTVNVKVSGASATKPLVARDDDVATRAGTPVTIHALANDSGTAPLTMASSGSPSHGTASCGSDGTCTYTPADGFSGNDGFVYTLGDGAERQANAAVHIVVAPSGAAFGISIDGSPADAPGTHNAVGAGADALWNLGFGTGPSGLSGEEASALGLPDMTIALTGPQALKAGSVKPAKGWTSDGATLRAGSGALLGEAVSTAFPKPLPPVSTGTGGDGHVPILVGTEVFAFYHHSNPTSVSCIDRVTGLNCPNYPKPLQVSAGNIIGPAAVIGTKMYVHALPAPYSYTQTAPIALFCWDAATDSTCGLTILDRVDQTSNPGGSAPILVGGKIYLAADTGRLYCFDPDSGAACATPSVPTGLDKGSGEYDVITHASRVYVSQRGDRVACLVLPAGDTCPGWASPIAFGGGTYWNVVNRHDGTGAVTGVCVFSAATGDCVTDADPTALTHVATWPATDPYYSVTEEAETGSRTLVGSLSHSGLGCFDWGTMAPCTGGSYGPDGWLTHDADGNALPDAYGAAWDGSCAVALGDQKRVFTVDPSGVSPCTSLSSGADKRVIDLRDQRCDGGVGSAAWRDVRLVDVQSGELSSVLVTVRDAQTNAVLATGQLVGGNGTLDLSGIDAGRHPAVTLDATSTSTKGDPAWDDGIPPRVRLTWRSDAQPLCFRAVTQSGCDVGPQTPIGAGAHLTGTAGDKQASLGMARSATCTVTAAASVTRCGGARRFVIHVRYKGKQVRRLSVLVNGVAQKVVTLKPRPVVRIDLRRLPVSTVKVKIRIRTKSGKLLTGVRVYHPCTKKLPNRGFRY